MSDVTCDVGGGSMPAQVFLQMSTSSSCTDAPCSILVTELEEGSSQPLISSKVGQKLGGHLVALQPSLVGSALTPAVVSSGRAPRPCGEGCGAGAYTLPTCAVMTVMRVEDP